MLEKVRAEGCQRIMDTCSEDCVKLSFGVFEGHRVLLAPTGNYVEINWYSAFLHQTLYTTTIALYPCTFKITYLKPSTIFPPLSCNKEKGNKMRRYVDNILTHLSIYFPHGISINILLVFKT